MGAGVRRRGERVRLWGGGRGPGYDAEAHRASRLEAAQVELFVPVRCGRCGEYAEPEVRACGPHFGAYCSAPGCGRWMHWLKQRGGA